MPRRRGPGRRVGLRRGLPVRTEWRHSRTGDAPGFLAGVPPVRLPVGPGFAGRSTRGDRTSEVRAARRTRRVHDRGGGAGGPALDGDPPPGAPGLPPGLPDHGLPFPRRPGVLHPARAGDHRRRRGPGHRPAPGPGSPPQERGEIPRHLRRIGGRDPRVRPRQALPRRQPGRPGSPGTQPRGTSPPEHGRCRCRSHRRPAGPWRTPVRRTPRQLRASAAPQGRHGRHRSTTPVRSPTPPETWSACRARCSTSPN